MPNDPRQDPVKRALSADIAAALQRERDELKEKLAAQEAADCPSCGARLERGDAVPASEGEKPKKKGKKKPPAEEPAPEPVEPSSPKPAGKKRKKDGRSFLDEAFDTLFGGDDEEDDDE